MMQPWDGMFITLEGPEGGGKTTQMLFLANSLRELGYDVLATREPGGTLIGDQIRQVLSDFTNIAMQPRTELLLFQASRAQLVEQVIRPHLQQGGIVLCDRYGDSTLAYQGYGHQLFELEEVRRLVTFATGGLSPDLTMLLDIDVEDGLQRKIRAAEWNRLDAYQVDFHQRVRQGYHALAAAEPQRWVVIDAGQPPEIVQKALLGHVLERLKNPHRRPDHRLNQQDQG
jgi:dTMP kinase